MVYGIIYTMSAVMVNVLVNVLVDVVAAVMVDVMANLLVDVLVYDFVWQALIAIKYLNTNIIGRKKQEATINKRVATATSALLAGTCY